MCLFCLLTLFAKLGQLLCTLSSGEDIMKADLLISGQEHRVTDVDGWIKSCKDGVKEWEDKIQQQNQQLLELEHEEG